MIPARSRLVACRLLQACVLGSVLLAGCAKHPTTKPTAAAHATSPVPPPSTPRKPAPAPTPAAIPNPPEEVTEDTGRTGIAACDDYLSSYLACHRAAQIYVPSQLQPRYEAMRSSLLRDAKNPQIRPQLSARCNSLATQLRQALHGKSCASAPAPATSSP